VPFPGEDHGEILRMKEAGCYTPARLLNPKTPPALEKILARMLAAQPWCRYQTASEVIVALQRTNLVGGLPSFADLGMAARDPVQSNRPATEPTRPDLRLRSSMSKKDWTGNVWYLRYRNRRGQMSLRKGTTEQVLQALELGRLKGTVLAARQRHLKFRPLSD